MRNWNKLLGYVAAFGIVGMAASEAWAACVCSPSHLCSGSSGAGITADVCSGKADIMAGFVFSAWQVGISTDTVAASCIKQGVIAGTINGSQVSGCLATDTVADDGTSATDTTGCTNVNGSLYQVSYCL